MAANTVYVFFDTTCPHCAELWTAPQPLLNRLKMVWMPIGLRPQSDPQGATILACARPRQGDDRERDQRAGARRHQRAFQPARRHRAEGQGQHRLFQQLQGDSVPLIVYRHAVSGEHGMYAGALDSAGLATLLGL